MASRLKPRIIPTKKVTLLAATLVVAVGAIATYAWHCSDAGINLDSVLVDGMTEQEVTAVLGGPPNEYYGKGIGVYYGGCCLAPETLSDIAYTKEWRNGEGTQLVHFDKNGQLLFGQRGGWARPPTLRQRIREFIQSFF